MRAALLLLVASLPAAAQVPQYVTADTYTRYELLAPESHRFRIFYEVTETRPGARYHFNVIRPGSQASDESVFDRATGKPLSFDIVTGRQAKSGEDAPESLREELTYIRVRLAQPVPAGGEARLLIRKTYMDAASYFTKDGLLVFARSLSIPRNSVVLPRGYELVSVNTPVEIATEPDGRVKVSFLNTFPQPVDFRLTARPLPRRTKP